MSDNFYAFSSARMKSERIRLGLKQAEAGVLCGVTREAWGKYERMQSVPGGDVLLSFSAAGADVHYILTGKRAVSEERVSQPQDGIDSIQTDIAGLVLKCNDLVQEQCVQAGFVMDAENRHMLAITMAHAVIKDFGFNFDKARPYLVPIVQVSIAHQRTPLSPQPKNDADESTVNEDDDFDPMDSLYLGDRK